VPSLTRIFLFPQHQRNKYYEVPVKGDLSALDIAQATELEQPFKVCSPKSIMIQKHFKVVFKISGFYSDMDIVTLLYARRFNPTHFLSLGQ
jgi:hypothetical protein